jgi:excisionase family DNA binding protein
MANELTLREASERLGLSRERVRMLIIQGEIAGRSANGSLIVDTASALEWALKSCDWRVHVARQKLKVAHDALRRAEERMTEVRQWAKEAEHGLQDGIRG